MPGRTQFGCSLESGANALPLEDQTQQTWCNRREQIGTKRSIRSEELEEARQQQYSG